jgi:hypothetical protein
MADGSDTPAEAASPTAPSATLTGQPNPPKAKQQPSPIKSEEAHPTTLTADPGLNQDIDDYMKTYVNELTDLGPEYAAEMQYLSPYLTGQTAAATNAAVSSGANTLAGGGVEAPNANYGGALGQALTTAEQNAGKVMESQQTPGFGIVAQGAKEQVSQTPYTAVLQAALQGVKNEYMGYSTVPEFSALDISQWSKPMQSLYTWLSEQAGGGSLTGSSIGAAANQVSPQGTSGTGTGVSPLLPPQSSIYTPSNPVGTT